MKENVTMDAVRVTIVKANGALGVRGPVSTLVAGQLSSETEHVNGIQILGAYIMMIVLLSARVMTPKRQNVIMNAVHMMELQERGVRGRVLTAVVRL